MIIHATFGITSYRWYKAVIAAYSQNPFSDSRYACSYDAEMNFGCTGALQQNWSLPPDTAFYNKSNRLIGYTDKFGLLNQYNSIQTVYNSINNTYNPLLLLSPVTTNAYAILTGMNTNWSPDTGYNCTNWTESKIESVRYGVGNAVSVTDLIAHSYDVNITCNSQLHILCADAYE